MEKRDSGNSFFTSDSQRLKTFVKSLGTLKEELRNIVENSHPALNGERYLTDKELSELLSVSRRTLHEWRANEVIGYIQLGGKILYRTSDVLALLDKNFHKPYEHKL